MEDLSHCRVEDEVANLSNQSSLVYSYKSLNRLDVNFFRSAGIVYKIIIYFFFVISLAIIDIFDLYCAELLLYLEFFDIE